MSVILTHVDSSRNLNKCERILNNLLITLLLFFSAMLFPFVIFAFNLNAWANLLPFILIGISFYFINKLVMLVDGHSGYAHGYSAGLSAVKI